jgi:hypothetical protein
MITTFARKIPHQPVVLPSKAHPAHGLKALANIDDAPPKSATERFNDLVTLMNAEVQLKLGKRTDAAQQAGQKSKQEGVPTGWEFEFDVTFDEQRWRFHKPTFAMRTQTWSFDWPELSKKEASFDIPDKVETRMVSKYIGDFWQCKGTLLQPTCGWWPAYIDVPEVTVTNKRVIFTVPEVTTTRKEFKWDVPEFYTEEVTWFVKIPQFKLVRAAAKYAEEEEAKAKQIEADTKAGIASDLEEIRAKYKDLLLQLSGEVATETRERLTSEYNVSLALFNGAIEGMQLQIAALPESERPKFDSALQEWIRNRQSFIDQYVIFMQSIDSQIQSMVQKVLDSLGQLA